MRLPPWLERRKLTELFLQDRRDQCRDALLNGGKTALPTGGKTALPTGGKTALPTGGKTKQETGMGNSHEDACGRIAAVGGDGAI